jgi:FkbM family methyltransferase
MSTPALTKVLKSLRYARSLANWRDVARAAWEGREVAELRLRNGVTVTASAGHGIVGMYKEIWYRDAYRLCAEPLPAGAIVVDVGANVGVFALYAAVVGRAARVYAYEPFPESFELLCANAARNRLDAIRPSRLAVGGERGQRRLFVGLGHGRNTLLGAAEQSSVVVECITLADVFERERIDRCDLLKLDCEGAEYEILLGAPGGLLRRVDRIAMEYHQVPAHLSEELVDLLRGAGFQVRCAGQARTGYLFARRLHDGGSCTSRI